MAIHSEDRFLHLQILLSALIAILCTFAAPAAAQDQPSPKWELYGGYSFFYPGGDIHGQLPLGLFPLSSRLESNPRGLGASVTYDFNRWFGLTLDASTHLGSGETTFAERIDDTGFANLSLGPKFTLRRKHFSPFAEVLVGDHRLMPDAFHHVDKLGLMLGGGVDLRLTRHIALRLLRADYVISNYRYGPPSVATTAIRGLRLQSGLNFTFGGSVPPPPPNRSPMASCSIDKTTIYAGSGDTAAVHAAGSDPDGDPLTYSWTTDGGGVQGTGPDARWNSTDASPGAYVVKARVDDGRGGTADCTAEIRVLPRPNRAPTMTCSADHTEVVIGQPVQIVATASDPDNDALTYSWNSNAGPLRSAESSARLDTGALKSGHYSVMGHVEDGRGGVADCQLDIAVLQPAPPPEMVELEAKLALHSIYFPTARPSVAKPEGGLVASQEEILRTLAEDFKKYLTYSPDAHLILGGHADQRGSQEYNKGLTDRRVARTKSFLVERGVSANAIEVRSFGDEDNLNAQQIKDQIAQNPDLAPDERRQMLSNLAVMVLANNRRVDVSLNTTGQQSTHRYPFNAKDYLKLIDTKSGPTKPADKPKRKRGTRQ